MRLITTKKKKDSKEVKYMTDEEVVWKRILEITGQTAKSGADVALKAVCSEMGVNYVQC